MVEAGRNRHHHVRLKTKCWHTRAQWAQETELRELRDQVKWYGGEGRKQGVHGGQTREEVSFEEDEQMAAKETACRASAEDR